MLGILCAMIGGGGDGASSGTIPVASSRAADDLSNAARFAAGEGRAIAARVWSRHEWDALPVAARPAKAQPTPDGRHWVALDVVAD